MPAETRRAASSVLQRESPRQIRSLRLPKGSQFENTVHEFLRPYVTCKVPVHIALRCLDHWRSGCRPTNNDINDVLPGKDSVARR